MTEFVKDNSIEGFSVKRESDDEAPGGTRVGFHVDRSVRANTTPTISARDVPEGKVVSIILVSGVTWTIADVGIQSRVQVRFRSNGSHQDATLHLAESVKGQVELDVAESRLGTITAAENCAGTLIHRDGSLVPGEEGLGEGLRFELGGGQLLPGKYGDVHLTSSSSISYKTNAPVSISRLVVDGDVELDICCLVSRSLQIVMGGKPCIRVLRAFA